MTYRLTTTYQDFKEEILSKYPMIANFDISEKETEMHNGTKRNVLLRMRKKDRQAVKGFLQEGMP